ncbi:Maltogenic Amylase, C-terminal domain [Mesonia phycicola]|uniref:Maltogenic Amylase, C-terminal domain n=1 Tax=Mesonia phycicola TaxID=579105 RepID=A0A1M6DV27_9FLAO|nr:alpha-amylase family glycosyl hydrolase [Mesonia phycicola]SHI76878.1 Maltogenic Amylase, C-terminal domain [Mesonia phycicola]
MKKKLILVSALALFISCKDNKQAISTDEASVATEEVKESIVPFQDEMMENAVIYEANIRQYSPEGSFEAFTKDIPKLKEMGVKILWVMPIYPISQVKKKSANGKFAEDIEDPNEREKILGSYYAISDYTAVNPEFGTKEDFRKLVKTAHENDIYVILDWVPNHTGWDHVWIEQHPDYYTQNENGEIIDPINPETGESWGWDDVADLNYDNPEMRKEMIADMIYWIKEENIDGFRCDVANNVPTNFWEQAIPQLRAEKNVFMLAEAWQPELMENNLFNMVYGWDLHHEMNKIAQGKLTAEAWEEKMKEVQEKYKKEHLLMNFTSNHDENSWNGTVSERLKGGVETFAALSFMAPGMPLIYSGQEYDMDKRLRFFEKDTIYKETNKMFSVYKKLGQLKNNSKALSTGEQPASYEVVENSSPKKVISFKRTKGKETIIYIANVTENEVEVELNLEGDFKDYMENNKTLTIKNNKKIKMLPWEYHILK